VKPLHLVAIESPYAGDVAANVEYAKLAMLDSLERGEAPFAMHLLYPQVLDDVEPEDRLLGIECGLSWTTKADVHAFYLDKGMSGGMRIAIDRAIETGSPVIGRSIRKPASTVAVENAEKFGLMLETPK
jgi:hypothetical protein